MPFVLGKRIGAGTYGAVHKGMKDGLAVAIKIMFHSSGDGGIPTTSLREACLLQLNHPNIVDVLAVGCLNDRTYIVMELCNMDLRQFVCNGVSVNPIAIITQILSAVAFLHGKGVAHRDLKPDNILMCDGGIAKLGDFGSARVVRDNMTGRVTTCWYRSPEEMLGCPKYPKEGDMWSIGCILAFLVNRDDIFNGGSEFECYIQICISLGSPNVATWPELMDNLTRGTKRKYPDFNPILPVMPPRDAGELLVTQDFVVLFRNLLRVNPSERVTAARASKYLYDNA
jgi:serine/threonine protein kinase